MKLLALLLLITAPTGAQSLPEKPQAVRAGDVFSNGKPLPLDWPNNLVVDYANEDHRPVWIAREINSCAMWCGRPMRFRDAMFDRKMLSAQIGLGLFQVADIESTHRAPCFVAHTCQEFDPLYGQSRAQAYAVATAANILTWVGTSYLRAGNTHTHVAGLRLWWIPHVVSYGFATGGIINTLSHWKCRC